MGKILLVDDEEIMRLPLSRLLRRAGYAVDTAEDGDQCLTRHLIRPADLVIIDMFMPKKAGLETILELLKEESPPVIIAMSAHPKMLEVLRATHGLECVRILHKPFEPEELLALVAEEMEWLKLKV